MIRIKEYELESKKVVLRKETLWRAGTFQRRRAKFVMVLS